MNCNKMHLNTCTFRCYFICGQDKHMYCGAQWLTWTGVQRVAMLRLTTGGVTVFVSLSKTFYPLLRTGLTQEIILT